jgi:hypothetical protein
MKTVFQKRPVKGFLFTVILPVTILWVNTRQAHSCPPPVNPTVTNVITLQSDWAEEVLSISPMSATSYATITWSSTGNNKLNITLLDVAGHAVLSRQYPLRMGVNELLLTSLETLPAGLYFVKAFDGAHHRKGKLIIHHTS